MNIKGLWQNEFCFAVVLLLLLLSSQLARGKAVVFLEYNRKIIAVVKAALGCDFGYRQLSVFEQILGMLKPHMS